MFEVKENSEQNEIFYEILSQSKEDRIKNKLWNELLMKPFGYSASCDWPTSFYFDELLAQNPNAKVVLTVRDNGEKWFESVSNSIWKVSKLFHGSWPLKLIGYLIMSKKQRLGQRMLIQDTIWKNPKLFDGKFEDKERSIKVYYDWIEFVKQTVPKDQLLIFNVKEGWEPLCKFLGVEQPKDCKEFPRSNSTKDMLQSPDVVYVSSLSIYQLNINVHTMFVYRKMMRLSQAIKVVTYAACAAAIGICYQYLK